MLRVNLVEARETILSVHDIIMSSILEVNAASSPATLPNVEDHIPVFTGLTSERAALRLWVPREIRESVFGYDEQPGFARFPKSQTEASFNARLVCTTASASTAVELGGLNLAFPKVHTFPSGDVLIASTRCHRWEDGSFELNAKVYRADGTVGTEFCLGDGLEHLAIDASGRIWAGYSDEGIYGNYGWGFDPIGAPGLVCFDGNGSPVWEFRPPPGLDPISHCYVLNCTDDTVWACYYTDFAIIRVVSDFKIAAWKTDLSGPRQMAVDDDRVLVYGGYMENANDCWLVQLRESTAERIAQVQLRLPEGAALDKATVVGRGRFLHVFAGDLWYRFAVPRD